MCFASHLLLLLVLFAAACESKETLLREAWRMTSADGVRDVAATSRVSYNASSWHAVQVPCTVLGGLRQQGLFPDIYRGLNLRNVATQLFNTSSWLFRSEFSVPSNAACAFLRFKGLSYRADVYVNGRLAASNLEGTFVYHSVALSRSVVGQSNNVVTVQLWRAYDLVWPPDNNSTDLGITWIDWSPFPPDGSLGIVGDVALVTSTSGYLLEYPVVQSRVNATSSDVDAQVSVEVTNCGVSAPPSKLQASAVLNGVTTTVSVSSLAIGESRLVQFPSVHLPDAPLWWPYQMGFPDMVPLEVFLATESAQFQVGLRQIDSGLDANGYRYYAVNGQRFLVRGGGWANELLLQNQDTWTHQSLLRTLDLGLNTIRLEGQLVGDDIFDRADRMGLFVVPGISCCDAWQHWRSWTQKTLDVAQATIFSQVRRIRSHPSALAFWYSSDELPPETVEKTYLAVLESEQWPNGLLASASNLTSKLTGDTGVKMSGPYQWVPPNFWLQDTAATPDPAPKGGAFGFLSEGGPGAAPMTWESLQENIVDLWPVGNEDWMYHLANPNGFFGRHDFFSQPLAQRFGMWRSAHDYSVLAQLQSYESYRAYFEAYNLNKLDSANGYVTWMLQAGRPQNQWHLFEYNFQHGGAYYGAKTAQPSFLHVMLNPVDWSVNVYNSLFSNDAASTVFGVSATVYDTFGKPAWTRQATITNVTSNAVVRNIFAIPLNAVLPDLLRFVELVITQRQQSVAGAKAPSFVQVIDRNVYWVAPEGQQDKFDFSQSDYSRVVQYANYSALSAIPLPQMQMNNVVYDQSCSNLCCSSVELVNVASTVAFFVRVRLVDANAKDVLPALWNNNFVTLFAGQQATLTASYDCDVSKGKKTFVFEPFSRPSN